MKQRFSALDVRATAAALRERAVGLRLQGIYDVNGKTLLLKFTRPGSKELVIIESGIRMHLTDYARDKAAMPSSFCIKLRKHLRARRLTAVQQTGMDRMVDFEFAAQAGAQAEGTYHIVCEFYAAGNIILTDHNYAILALMRVVRIDDEIAFGVGRTYPLPQSRDIEPVGGAEIAACLARAGPAETLKRCLAQLGAYGPALAESIVVSAGLRPGMRVAAEVDVGPQSPHVAALAEAYAAAFDTVERLGREVLPGYITLKQAADGGEDMFDDLNPWRPAQSSPELVREFASFADAADTYFSSIEAQKLRTRAHQQEAAAERKLDAARAEHHGRVAALEKQHEHAERQARRIEANLEFVDQAIAIIRQAVAAGMDWRELEELVADQRSQDNPVAERIVRLNLAANQITLRLDPLYDAASDDSDSDSDAGSDADSGPLEVDVDIFDTAFANAQRYYNTRRQAGVKHARTLAASTKALQSAEQKIRADLKSNRVTATVSQMRKAIWFEKFSWFVSSDGFLVVAGHDMQQNELLVKRHLRPGDAYVHADLHGAASVIIKNNRSTAPGEAPSADTIPPSTLFQAGIMSVCQSRAWDAKILASAWWVEAHQVSKTAPTGEYLTTGSFMIRGKKRTLPPAQLVYGFGVMFRLADDESIARHAAARQQRRTVMEEGLRAAAPTSASVADADDAGDVTIVGGASQPPAAAAAAAVGGLDFDAARRKYNLDEIDATAEDAFEGADQTQAGGGGGSSSKRYTSAKERRDQRKQKQRGGDADAAAPPAPTGKLSKKDQRRLDEEAKYAAKDKQPQKQQQQQMKRGQKSKARKRKEKYAEQDDEDRDLRMALLGAAGKVDPDAVLAKAAPPPPQEDEESESDSDPEDLPPSIVDQIAAMSVDSPDEPAAEPAAEPEDDDDEQAADLLTEQLDVLDMLTAAPVAGDNLSFAIPVCAPYPALAGYKYRVKLVPGTTKKGKACKMAQTVMLAAADGNRPKTTAAGDPAVAERLELEDILAQREKSLIRTLPEMEMIAQMLGKVKVSAPNMDALKQKSKAAAKTRAKAKAANPGD
ncbi:hypothetical protein IWQ56_000547 [Coemansia nantahalensis]|uniref:Uncharacterized protein n=1 Tax=Coemansia nantahalensis TaxID=2789366 RepID=A0ACC1K847_9FUNG|nr:hypothetical protein IWQ56_000547 [Coemansia nantahalensis]KAJ2775591.1 hypothetical protein IWQ57_000341 [Coemansia nantahalensis]